MDPLIDIPARLSPSGGQIASGSSSHCFETTRGCLRRISSTSIPCHNPRLPLREPGNRLDGNIEDLADRLGRRASRLGRRGVDDVEVAAAKLIRDLVNLRSAPLGEREVEGP